MLLIEIWNIRREELISGKKYDEHSFKHVESPKCLLASRVFHAVRNAYNS